MMKKTILSLAVISLFAFDAYAGPTEITIYNQNLALLKKSQEMNLKTGVNEIVFDEVAEQMKPESAFIYGDGIRVLEQNYDYAGINYQTMLNAYVGKKVNTVRQNPQTGANIFEKATLIAVDGATPVLQFDYGINPSFNGRVVFDNVPPELNSTPILMAKVETAQAGEKNLNLAYLAKGFNWSANYVAKVNDENTMSLIGRAAITNNSGSGYDEVKVNLIAGDVHTVEEFLQPRMMKSVRGAMLMANAVSESFDEGAAVIDAPSSMDSYYIYNIPGTTSLKNGQMKQISFINAPKIQYQKEGVVTSSLYFSTTKSSYKDVHPTVFYRFVNNNEDGLGMPLPQGKISFYAPDDNNSLQFIGENNIADTAVGQKVSVQLGKLFDVYAEAKITDIRSQEEHKYKKQPKDECLTTATTYRYDVIYKVSNGGNKKSDIVLKQPLNGKAKIIKQSLEGAAGEGNMYEWHFTLDAGKQQEITVEVENVIEQRRCDAVEGLSHY